MNKLTDSLNELREAHARFATAKTAKDAEDAKLVQQRAAVHGAPADVKPEPEWWSLGMEHQRRELGIAAAGEVKPLHEAASELNAKLDAVIAECEAAKKSVQDDLAKAAPDLTPEQRKAAEERRASDERERAEDQRRLADPHLTPEQRREIEDRQRARDQRAAAANHPQPVATPKPL